MLRSVFNPLPNNIKRTVIAFVALTLALSSLSEGAKAAPSGARLWVKRFGATTGGDNNAVAVTPGGSKVFVTGDMEAGLVTAGYTAAGDKLWLRTYNGEGGCCIDYGSSIVVSPDGSMVVVTGATQVTDGTIDIVTLAYDVATGDNLWTKVFDRGSMDGDENTYSQNDYGFALGISPDGATVFVTGDSEYSTTEIIKRDIGTVAYDTASGDLQWASFYDGGVGYDGSRSLAVAPDGSAVYVTGLSASAENQAVITVAYDASDGAEIWAEPYEGPAGQADAGWSIAARPDGSAVYVTGGTGGSGSGTADWNMLTAAFDTSDGSLLWDKLYKGRSGGYDFGRSIAVSPGGRRVYILGHSLGASGLFNSTTVAYRAGTGKKVWSMSSAGPDSNVGLVGDIGVSLDGSTVFVTTNRTKADDDDLLTVSYSAAGAERWKATYDGGLTFDRARGLAVSPKGTKVFVAASVHGGATLAYKT